MVVTVKIQGGLGNQIFQLFATIAYSLEHNHSFIFPYTNNIGDRPDRPRYWKTFFKDLLIYTTSNNETYTDKILSEFPLYIEDGFHYTKIPTFNSDKIRLDGYFQSYKYFQDYKEQIFNLIHLKEQLETVKNDYSDIFYDKNTPCISMHFRLGDYKLKPDCHNIISIDYYDEALCHIINKINKNNLKLLIFCENEDNNYVFNVIQLLNNKYKNISFIKINDKINDWEQMLLMSLCDHNIIANSSFSYFGAYFNENPEKIVCYPSKWFGPRLSNSNTNDLCPPEWKKINL